MRMLVGATKLPRLFCQDDGDLELKYGQSLGEVYKDRLKCKRNEGNTAHRHKTTTTKYGGAGGLLVLHHQHSSFATPASYRAFPSKNLD